MKRAFKVCLPLILFCIFLMSGGIALLSEQMHNDLATSTGAFVGSFTVLAGFAYKLYNAFFL